MLYALNLIQPNEHVIFLPFVMISQVLKKEFPKGLDIIYESVGGDMFNLCLNALAVYGRLIVIGMISQVRGFFFHFFFLKLTSQATDVSMHFLVHLKL